ncbi:thiamine-phosphate kinase [Rothia nasimurium]|uniref:thiamine-phosphate kinase n=1 Tax=Rothia nasimurium TaxID=85336 RepID=UPI001F006D43|nr:thiamine-phosphate kinase [Rothia nasimurium]
MLVSDVSEGQLLAAFLPLLQAHNAKAEQVRAQALRVAALDTGSTAGAGQLVIGPGDDSAALDLRSGLTVMSIDTQTENQDFRRTWASGHQTGGYEVGWKAATQNLADIAAMGAVPVSLLVSLTLTPDTPVTWVTDFARGMTESARAQGAVTCTIAGGDLGSGSELSVTVTSIGLTADPVTRSGAQAGDVLVVAGSLGTAAAGLALLDHPEPYRVCPAIEACLSAQQRPVSPLQLGASHGNQLNSMLDVSDGLVRDAGRIAEASGVSISLDSEALGPWVQRVLPAAQVLAQGKDADALALRWVLTGGEDHALLATCPAGQIPAGFTRIGEVGTGNGVTVDGRIYQGKGWDHFEPDTH